jgi:hypothetical protein
MSEAIEMSYRCHEDIKVLKNRQFICELTREPLYRYAV